MLSPNADISGTHLVGYLPGLTLTELTHKVGYGQPNEDIPGSLEWCFLFRGRGLRLYTRDGKMCVGASTTAHAELFFGWLQATIPAADLSFVNWWE